MSYFFRVLEHKEDVQTATRKGIYKRGVFKCNLSLLRSSDGAAKESTSTSVCVKRLSSLVTTERGLTGKK